MKSDLVVHHTTSQSVEQLLDQGSIDCLIADSEDGFSQLGEERRFLSEELGYPDTSLHKWLIEGYPDRLEASIGQLADWCRGRSPEITIAVIPSRRLDSRLKGLILSPYDGSKCYLQFANGEWARPYRDFMYSVAWECLHQAFHRLGARHPATMHLSRVKTWRWQFKWEVTFCQVEAALNFHDENPDLESLTFLDPCPGNCVAWALRYFRGGHDRSPHRPITRYSTEQWGIHFVTIDWRRGTAGSAQPYPGSMAPKS
jgi:hypothetical protein